MRVKTIIILLLFTACNNIASKQETEDLINETVNKWHLAASETNDSIFFGIMAPNSIYIGTDANELWTKGEFYEFAIEYFSKGKAWNFRPIERNVYFSGDSKTIWFDEKLDTWMGICRASGVLEQFENEWKIVHYHLSMTIPNEKVRDVIEIIEQE